LVQPSHYTLRVTTYLGSTGKTKLNEKTALTRPGDGVTRAERPEALRAATLAQRTFWKTALFYLLCLEAKTQTHVC
jgi:hypothetical protein